MSALAEHCRRCYDELSAECTAHGIDAGEAEKSLLRLSTDEGAGRRLLPLAYLPTGLALGCPLPEKDLTRQLRDAAERVASSAPRLAGGGLALAFVPPEAYHVTVISLSSFESDSSLQFLTAELAAGIARLLTRTPRRDIAIDLDGYVLTAKGRLLVRGVPTSPALAELRQVLRDHFPELRRHRAEIAHIKLGHLLTPLDRDHLELVLGAVEAEGLSLKGRRVSFDDLYTPAGRIRL
jgi:2'-5' RNA ligase